MKKNMITLLGIALVVAILATGLFYGLVVMKMDQDPKSTQDVIVVAARDLAPGDVLAPSDVKLAASGPEEALVDGFTSTGQLAGLTLIEAVAAGKPVTRGIVVSKDSPGGAALGVRPGFRAISVHVADSTGVISLLQPGHRVDAQIVYAGTAGRNSAKTLRTMLQNLEVLAVDPKLESGEGERPLPVVTLLARPDEADLLGLADAAAQIRLVLRHPLDDEITPRGNTTLAAAFKKAPPKHKPATRVSETKAQEEKEEKRPVQSADGRLGQP